MSISDNYAPDKTSGNGVTVAFTGNWNTIASSYFRLYWEDKTTGVQTLKTLGTHYTLAFTASGYTATHDALYIPPSTVWVIRAREITKDQTDPYKTSTGFQGAVVENSFDKLTAITQDLQNNDDRTIKFPIGNEATITDPVYGDLPEDGFAVVWDGTAGRMRNTAASLADLEGDAEIVADNIASVNTVAASIASVISVAANATNINIVAGSITNVNLVGSDIASVITVASNIASVNTVAGISASVSTVAGVASAVSTVAGISANVTTVAGISSDVTDVAAIAVDVTTVANNAASIEEAAEAVDTAIKFTFDTSTTMADPGVGDLRLNNATLSSVTAIAIDDTTAQTGNPDISAFIATWDDGTGANKGTLRISKGGSPSTFAIYTITALTDNAGWTELAVTHVSSNGTFSASDNLYLSFSRTGDTGAAGSVSDGDKGDIVVTSSGATWTLETVNANVGSFTNSSITVNAKGLITAASSGSGGSSWQNNGYATNRYYFGGLYALNGGSSFALSANRLYFRPFLVGASETFTRIGFEVSSLSAGNARLGIYNATNGLPSTLVLDAGTVSTGTTGEKEVTISQALTPGVYFLALVSDATATVLSDGGEDTELAAHIIGNTTGSDAGSLTGGYTAFAYAALPSPYAGAVTYAGAGGGTPGLWLRKV